MQYYSSKHQPRLQFYLTRGGPKMATQEATKSKPVATIEITVNKKPVVVEDKELTGMGIKQAAIDAGVQIGLNFQLAIMQNKKTKIVGDDETIHVHKGEEFRATAPDDNS